jgi:CheY-like chemotaxis protein
MSDISSLARAQRENRSKDEFLAMLAHELRNPLGAIVNANLVASRPEIDAQTRVWSHQVIERQTRQLTRLVDDLLDLSRISSGKVRLQLQPLDAVQILTKAVEVAQRAFDQKGQKLDVSIPDAVLPVQADPARLEQILVNVLSNANKYTPEGGSVRVTAAREGEYAVVRVTDTGRGIAPDMLGRIFEAFTQVDDSLDRAQSGLGLGLTVVKHLIEEHGGYVRAESGGLGHGSTFAVGIPIRMPSAAQSGAAEGTPRPAADARRRVLLIEDHKDNAQTLAALLEQAGHSVFVTHDGRDAVLTAERVRPEVVLLDLGLPGVDGYNVAAALRRHDATADALIVAISGYGQQRDRDRSRAAGIDRHFL